MEGIWHALRMILNVINNITIFIFFQAQVFIKENLLF